MKAMLSQPMAGKSEQEMLYLRLLLVTDFISGMTDSYAIAAFEELFIPKSWSVK